MTNPSRALLILLVALGFGAAFWAGQNTRSSLYEKPQSEAKSTIHQNLVISSVSALGTLEPSGDVYVMAGPITQLGGAPRIKSINVNEGDRVARNQVLATFDNSPEILAEYNRIVANIESKKSEIKILKQQTKRFEQLTATGSFPVAELEEKNVRLAGFQSQLQELLGTLKTSKERLASDTVIRSSINGVVLKVNGRVGERAQESGVIEIGNTNKMQAVIEVDESDIGLIRIGQPVKITSENGAFSKTLNGTVSSIGLKATARRMVGQDPGVAPDSEVRVIDVRVNLDSKSSRQARTLTGVKIMAVIRTS
jgi:HlyD family secretion protein